MYSSVLRRQQATHWDATRSQSSSRPVCSRFSVNSVTKSCAEVSRSLTASWRSWEIKSIYVGAANNGNRKEHESLGNRGCGFPDANGSVAVYADSVFRVSLAM